MLDVQPDGNFFANRGLGPPAFVASDFITGGEAIGAIVVEELKKNGESLALICIGPKDSWPGRVRSSRLMYELGREDLLRRIFTFELPSWQPDNFITELYNRVTDLANQNRSLIVYCGNDRTMLALERRLDAPGQTLLGEINLIGYDGVITNDGSLVVEDCPRAMATVDTRPRIQGHVAAELLREVYTDGKSSHPFHLIEPVILRSPYWKT